MSEAIAGALIIPLLIGGLVFSIVNWIHFQKVKKLYAGVFTTNQVKRYVNWGMWPVIMVVGAGSVISGLISSNVPFLNGLFSGAFFILAGLFCRWRCAVIYGKALERCPEELKAGLRRAILCVSFVCQWRFVFAMFGAAADIAAFNAVMQYGGTITITTTTTTERKPDLH